MKQNLKKETIYYEERKKYKNSDRVWKSGLEANFVRIIKRAIYKLYNYK